MIVSKTIVDDLSKKLKCSQETLAEKQKAFSEL